MWWGVSAPEPPVHGTKACGSLSTPAEWECCHNNTAPTTVAGTIQQSATGVIQIACETSNPCPSQDIACHSNYDCSRNKGMSGKSAAIFLGTGGTLGAVAGLLDGLDCLDYLH